MWTVKYRTMSAIVRLVQELLPENSNPTRAPSRRRACTPEPFKRKSFAFITFSSSKEVDYLLEIGELLKASLAGGLTSLIVGSFRRQRGIASGEHYEQR